MHATPSLTVDLTEHSFQNSHIRQEPPSDYQEDRDEQQDLVTFVLPTTALDDLPATSTAKSFDSTKRIIPSDFNSHMLSNVSHTILRVESTERRHVNMTTPKELSAESAQQPEKLFLSFAEWKRIKLGKNEDIQSNRKSTQPVRANGRQQQTIDSIDGVFSDDFGSMFEGLSEKSGSDVYEEGEYIAPSRPADYKPSEDLPKNTKPSMPIKTLKERSNYASTDCAATVRAANLGAKRSSTILYESKDQYMLNKCSADKYVIIKLCEEIMIDTIVLANFEFFSSTFKDFRVYVAERYPTVEWKLLGQWQARNTRDLQIFKVEDRFGWPQYMKIEFLTHYGHEYYCPLSLVRVHGMPMLELFNLYERESLSGEGEQDPVMEEDYLWPAEVSQDIIKPKIDVSKISEQPFHTESLERAKSSLIPYPTTVAKEEVQSLPSPSPTLNSLHTEGLPPNKSPISDMPTKTTQEISIDPTTSLMQPIENNEILSKEAGGLPTTLKDESIHINLEDIHSQASKDEQPSNSISPPTASATMDETTSSVGQPKSNNDSGASEEERAGSPKPIPSVHTKEANTQESIYKTIMKRINALELNVTLSQGYMDEQNKMLNDVFMDMKKRHQDQLLLVIGHLNETASVRIEGMKRRYEQSENDLKEMVAKMSILEEQIAFERRMSMAQLIILIILFTFMVLSRGNFSTLPFH
ncbi:hypothetical protein DFQ30_010058 [Apophysomyces sp. BC1015]|nr:hypothetical protein DFQ30_010058 [Apophysomyces sp. BC1015]